MRETLADDERPHYVARLWGELGREAHPARVPRATGQLGFGRVIKSNDDLRQEVCALQLIELSRLFDQASLPLPPQLPHHQHRRQHRAHRVHARHLHRRPQEAAAPESRQRRGQRERQRQRRRRRRPRRRRRQHRIPQPTLRHDVRRSTNQSVSPIATSPNNYDFSFFLSRYGADTQRCREARWRFASSLAAYSVVSYVFAIKVLRVKMIKIYQSTTNLASPPSTQSLLFPSLSSWFQDQQELLDTEGHLIHIDFRFILGIAPGSLLHRSSALQVDGRMDRCWAACSPSSSPSSCSSSAAASSRSRAGMGKSRASSKSCATSRPSHAFKVSSVVSVPLGAFCNFFHCSLDHSFRGLI